MSDDRKAREARARRAAQRQGLRLEKSRTRDPRALGFGGYMLVDIATNGVIVGGTPIPYSLDLSEVEDALR